MISQFEFNTIKIDGNKLDKVQKLIIFLLIKSYQL